jgi:Immunity protein 53
MMHMSQADLLARLCEWYREQCNGDWEHGSGVLIDTLDNPGWMVKIDLRETALENEAFETIKIDKGKGDWLWCFKKGQEFNGSGDPSKLPVILEHFLMLVGKL